MQLGKAFLLETHTSQNDISFIFQSYMPGGDDIQLDFRQDMSKEAMVTIDAATGLGRRDLLIKTPHMRVSPDRVTFSAKFRRSPGGVQPSPKGGPDQLQY